MKLNHSRKGRLLPGAAEVTVADDMRDSLTPVFYCLLRQGDGRDPVVKISEKELIVSAI